MYEFEQVVLVNRIKRFESMKQIPLLARRMCSYEIEEINNCLDSNPTFGINTLFSMLGIR